MNKKELSLSRISLLALALLLVPPALQSGASQEESDGPNPAQAIVAYSFLAWGSYDAFDQLLVAKGDFPTIQKLTSLDGALKSLGCDVRKRIAMAERPNVIVLPSAPVGRWISLTPPSRAVGGGWLFVMKAPGDNQPEVLIVFSTDFPPQTTVFWLKEVRSGYETDLLFDTFEKGKVSNDTTQVGAATTVKFESPNAILLKDWGEPGTMPSRTRDVRRVFRLDLSKDVVTEVFPGVAPRH